MFRISRSTDYGIVLLAHMARRGDGEDGSGASSARELAREVGLPAPMVRKILKGLARGGLLESHRGAKGGYRLTRRPENLSVAEMVSVLEGPVALTDCSIDVTGCEHAGHCAVRGPWSVINEAVTHTLSEMTLADLIDPGFPRQSDALRILGAPEPMPLAAGGGSRQREASRE